MPPSDAIAARRCSSGISLGCTREAVGHRDVRVGDPLDDLERRPRSAGREPTDACCSVGGSMPSPVPWSCRLGQRLAGLGEHPLELALVVAQRLLGLLDRDVAAADQRLGVDLAHRALVLDQRVHQRLGHRRVVALVVAAPAVADQVDDDVLAERLAVLERQLGDPDAGLGVVAVHVEDRRLDHPRHVGAVERRARRGRRRGEADLVVDDDVHGAAGAVAAQLRQVQRLGHDALAGERGVAVQQHRQHGEALLALVDAVLLGADDALEHRVDRLEVRRVGGQVDLGLAAVRGGELALGAEVVLHVAGALHRPRVLVALELAEDLAVGLAGEVGEHVEPAAVRHADA